MNGHRRKDPTLSFAVAAAAATCGIAYLLWRDPPGLHPLAAWILAVSGATFFAFGLDKFLARKEALRVPERVLLGLAFAGGAPAAWLGMILFHHKTVKTSFRVKFWLVFFLEVLLAAGWFYLNHRNA